jgi:UDP-N-acetylglucosamine transferase subunit ALG13
MIFLTVGTQFAFDRLVRAVDEAVGAGLITEPVFAQIGESRLQPQHFPSVAALDKKEFDEKFRGATRIISHAGMGTIIQALDHDKPLLVMPRRRCHGEVVNDHQVGIARRFEAEGYLLVAYEEQDVPAQARSFTTFVPRPRQRQTAQVVGRLAQFLRNLGGSGVI